jgi:hypothetical protein
LRLKSLSGIIAFALTAVLPSASQSNYMRQETSAHQRVGIDEGRLKIERDMAKKANEARQADLRRDTGKLLKLATELQEYVDKTNEGMLSVNVIKKAEEIEKLAHSVKEKMKGSP